MYMIYIQYIGMYIHDLCNLYMVEYMIYKWYAHIYDLYYIWYNPYMIYIYIYTYGLNMSCIYDIYIWLYIWFYTWVIYDIWDTYYICGYIDDTSLYIHV